MAAGKLDRILMVEDEADIQRIAVLALEVVGGFTVKVCRTGREAVESAVKFSPDLILLDVVMPGLDGPATLRELRALPSLALTPVIFMTARSRPQEIDEYKRLGALDVIVKPFDPMKLAQNINTIWSEHYG